MAQNRRSGPIDPVEVDNEIRRLVDLLEDETEAFEKLAVDAAEKEADYKGAWSSAYLTANGPVKERESWSDYQCADQNRSHKISEALVKAKRERLSSLRTSLDSLRTLAANVRSQVQH